MFVSSGRRVNADHAAGILDLKWAVLDSLPLFVKKNTPSENPLKEKGFSAAPAGK
jgi:hypothetical protein